MRPYICFHKGKSITVEAVTSYQAQLLAVAAFKLRPNQRYEVTVMLADVTHTAVN